MVTGIFCYASYMKAKEWAKANGFPDISLGKGRMPNDARAAVEAYVAGGGHIEGYATKPSASTDKPVEVVRQASNPGVTENPEETVPEAYNIAMVGNVVIGNRTVCDTCRRSLNYHICESPRVMYNGVSSVVTFKSRPNPQDYRNRWW